MGKLAEIVPPKAGDRGVIIPPRRSHDRLWRGLAILSLVTLFIYWLNPLWSLPPGRLIAGHSPAFDVLRSVGVIDAWRAGILDARIIPCFDAQYGYPIHGLYAPLFSWTGAAGILLTGSWQWGMTITIAAWLALGTVGIFLAARQFWAPHSPTRSGFFAGWLAAVGWLISPYNAFNIYERSDGAEFAASMMLGWILWSAMRLLASAETRLEQRLLLTIPLALSIAVAILAHNVYGLYCFGYAAAIVMICIALPASSRDAGRHWLRRGNIALYTLGIAFGLALSVFFWAPAMAEMHYTHVYSHFARQTGWMTRSLLTLRQVFSFETVVKAADFPGQRIRWNPQLGWICAAAFLSTLAAVLISLTQRRWNMLRTLGTLLLATVVLIWFVTIYAAAFWFSHPTLIATQFAWRMMPFAELTLCLLLPSLAVASANLRPAAQRLARFCLIGLLLAVTIRSARLYIYQRTIPMPDASVFSRTPVRTAGVNEYATIWQDRKAPPHTQKAGQITPIGPVQLLTTTGQFNNLKLVVNNPADQPGALEVAYNYFPGWYAHLRSNDQPLQVEPGREGIIRITGIPPGTHGIRLGFANTPIRVAMKLLSASSAGLLVMIALAVTLPSLRNIRRANHRALASKPLTPSSVA